MKLNMCRRTAVSLVAIAALVYLGDKGHDVAFAIASVAAALSGANAWQSRLSAPPKAPARTGRVADE